MFQGTKKQQKVHLGFLELFSNLELLYYLSRIIEVVLLIHFVTE
jgi:hypothetical protein